MFSDKDYQGEVEFIKKIVKERSPYAKNILDIGCGTGTHLNLLLDDFEFLYGVDLNPEVVEEAKKKSPRIKYVVGGMADFKIDKKFDVVICLFSVFNYNISFLETSDFLVLIKNKNGVDFFTETGHQYRIYQIKEFSDMLRRTSFTNIEVFDNFTNRLASRITTYPVFVASLK